MGAFRGLLRIRNFRLLWAAGALAAIGDQFDLIAFPWLVLAVTGDPLAVGAVLAVGSIPGVFFMVLGGALADRFSPLPMMRASGVASCALAALLAAMVLTGLTDLRLIYAFALLKGIADSLYYPAGLAMLPRIVPAGWLRQSNAVIQTTTELGGFAGPALAGALIASFAAGPEGGRSLTGIGLAFAVAAAAFTVGLSLLLILRPEGAAADAGDGEAEGEDAQGIFASIGQGIRFVRADAALFTVFLLAAGVELFVEGPVMVGIPLLADTKLAQGALALGVVSSSYAGGALLGALLAGAAPVPRRGMGLVMLAVFSVSGLLLMPFGFLTSMTLAAGVMLLIGVSGGYTDVLFTSWLQARTPARMRGRVMSLVMVAAVGVSPISNAAAGALIRISLEWVFVGAGALMTALCLAAALRPEVRAIRMPDGAGESGPA